MGNPRIIYDGTNLDFPNRTTFFILPQKIRAVRLFSDGGIHATSVRTRFLEGILRLEKFEDLDFERRLHKWWTWANQGLLYAVARDSSETADTTLDGAAAAAQKTIPLTSTAGITVGQDYRISEANGPNREIVKVASIVGGVSVDATDNLKYTYASADIFRAREFLPKVSNLDDAEPWQPNLGITFSFIHRFREDAT